VNDSNRHKAVGIPGPFSGLVSLLLIGLVLGGCEETPDLTVPAAGQVEAAYMYGGALTATLSGNVAEITIVQPARQIERGGTLWVKVGPYVLLFSRETQELFQRYPGLAAVRAITRTSDGTEVARATLSRNALNDLTWRRALNISGLARRDGTRRPTLLEDLVEWGEDHTDYDYNPRYSRP
jgi:hypothetical protein